MKRKKSSEFRKVIFWLIVVLALLFSNINYFVKEVWYSTKRIEPYAFVDVSEYTVESSKEDGLSTEQKISDFLYMTEILEKSYSLNSVDEEMFAFQIEEKNEEFLKLVRESKSDIEFYCILWKYFSTVNSAHTGLPFPSLERYEHNKAKAYEGYEELTIEEYAKYWEDVFQSIAEYYSEDEGVSFLYAEGRYFLEGSDTDYIVEMNGMSVEQYLEEAPMANRRYYDSIQEKFYYDRLVFHEETGVPVRITMASGEVLEVCYDEIYECYCHNAWRIGEKEEGKEQEIRTCLNENGEIAYLRMGSFEWEYYFDLKERMEFLTKEKEGVKYLLLDLRDNSGGAREPMAEIVVSCLSDQRINMKYQSYIPYTVQNAKWEGYNGSLTKKVPEVLENGEWFFEEEVELKTKGEIDFSGDVYVLIDSYTCSAADYMAAVLKDKGLGILVGENTSGEGLGSTAYSFVLPNSGLMIEYMAGQGMNSDGTLNSRCGTAPDYYVERSISDINYREQGRLFETWEDLLKNDSQIQYIYEHFILKN